MKNHLKPMGVRDVLDSTFTIMRENFWSFQGVFFKAFLPALIILVLGTVFTIVYFVLVGMHTHIPITSSLFWSEIGHNSLLAVIVGILLMVVILVAFVIALFIGGIYYTYGNFKIFKNGLHDQKTSSEEAFRGIKANRVRIFLVQFIIGILLFVIALPGAIISIIVKLQAPIMGNIISFSNDFLRIIFSFFFCMALPVTVFEDFDVMKSIGRGFKLMAKHRWRIFGTLLLVYLLGYALGIIILGLIAIPIVGAVFLKNIATYIAAGIFCLGGLFILIQLCAYFFGPLAAIYYDLIIRKEGYDISMQLADEGGVVTPVQSL